MSTKFAVLNLTVSVLVWGESDGLLPEGLTVFVDDEVVVEGCPVGEGVDPGWERRIYEARMRTIAITGIATIIVLFIFSPVVFRSSCVIRFSGQHIFGSYQK